MRTRQRWFAVTAAVGMMGVVAALALTPMGAARAEPDPGPIGVGSGIATETTIGSLLNIGSVIGGQDPSVIATDPYPAAPSVGVPIASETTAQAVMVDINDPGGPIQGLAYCINLTTDTTVGVNYRLGEWAEATVPNLEYVDYILTHYFPNEPTAPAGTPIQKVAAVQAAIWFFTDDFVLTAADPARPATAAIVADAQAGASGGQPPLPTLSISPTTAAVPTTGDLVGPFTVGGTVASATLQALGVQVFADAAGTQPLADGDSVAPGAQLWVRYLSGGPPLQGFRLTSIQSIVHGNVFLYDGTNAGRTAAQKLVLAASTDLPLRAGVLAAPFDAGAIEITKTIAGAGAGLQSEATIGISCDLDETVTDYSVIVPAGLGAGDHVLPLVSGIAAGSVCTIGETAGGGNAQAMLRGSSVTPSTVTIGNLTTSSATVTNTYDLVPQPDPTTGPTNALAASGSDGGQSTPLLMVGSLLLAVGVLGLVASLSRARPGSPPV